MMVQKMMDHQRRRYQHKLSVVFFERDGGLESSEIRVSQKRNPDSLSSTLSSHQSKVHVEVDQNKKNLGKMWAAIFARVRDYHKRLN